MPTDEASCGGVIRSSRTPSTSTRPPALANSTCGPDGGGGDLLTPDIVAVPWQRLILYPAEIAARPGRAWRPLSDDVNYPLFMLRQAVPWRNWQRRRDYYAEGVMLWLDVDAELRARSGGRRGMDDFTHQFSPALALTRSPAPTTSPSCAKP